MICFWMSPLNLCTTAWIKVRTAKLIKPCSWCKEKTQRISDKLCTLTVGWVVNTVGSHEPTKTSFLWCRPCVGNAKCASYTRKPKNTCGHALALGLETSSAVTWQSCLVRRRSFFFMRCVHIFCNAWFLRFRFFLFFLFFCFCLVCFSFSLKYQLHSKVPTKTMQCSASPR